MATLDVVDSLWGVIQQPDLDAVHDRYPPVDARVAEILENIRRDCRELRLGRRLDAQTPSGR
jgi:hypothetical protein